MSQLDMFDQPVAIPSRAPSEMRPRLSRQCEELLAMLKRAPMTNRAMASAALNYRARISELRQAGYDVVILEHNRETGLVTYALKETR